MDSRSESYVVRLVQQCPFDEEVTVSIAKLAMPNLTDDPSGVTRDLHVGPGVHPIYPVAYAGDGARLLSGMIAEFRADRIAAWFAKQWDKRMTLIPGDLQLDDGELDEGPPELTEDELWQQQEHEAQLEHLMFMEEAGGMQWEDDDNRLSYGELWPERPIPNVTTRRLNSPIDDEIPFLSRTVH